jgi:hypothetical protein
MASLFTLLPLPLAESHPNPAFAFANGQCLAYKATAYAQDQPHQVVASSLLDDVGIAQQVKQRRQRVNRHSADYHSAWRALSVYLYVSPIQRRQWKATPKMQWRSVGAWCLRWRLGWR